MSEAKCVIELDQKGNALRVFVAAKSDGSPLKDLTDEGEALTQEELKLADPIPGHPRRATMAFYEGNCVIINGKKYCT